MLHSYINFIKNYEIYGIFVLYTINWLDLRAFPIQDSVINLD